MTDAKGKPIAIKGGFLPNNCSWKKVNLAPGKSIELWQWQLNLRPESESTNPPPDNPPYAIAAPGQRGFPHLVYFMEAVPFYLREPRAQNDNHRPGKSSEDDDASA